MAVVIVATPGAANANSFETLAEALAYFETRFGVPGWDVEWELVDNQSAMLVMATRTIVSLFSPRRALVRDKDMGPYYRTFPTWTGSPASATQALPWPRIGMFDRNGNAIASNVIPQALKDAESEMANQLAKADRTLDNDISIQGITSVKAGSVALTFKDNIEVKPLPDAVFNLLVPSWLTDEIITPAWPAEFDVI